MARCYYILHRTTISIAYFANTSKRLARLNPQRRGIMPNISAFVTYLFASALSPGVNNILAMSYTGRYGFKRIIGHILGVFVGIFFVAILCGFFSLKVSEIFPFVNKIMVFVGATYILWLAWSTFKSRPYVDDGSSQPPKSFFIPAVFVQIINPSAIFYCLSVFSTFVVPYYTSMMSILLFSLLLAFFSIVGTVGWSIFGSIFRKVIIKRWKLVNAIMAAMLVYCAFSLIYSSFSA